MKTQISKNIRKFRLSSNMTQEILADRLGVSTQAVSRWENAVTLPDITLLPVIANIFNVTIDTLFGNNKDDIQHKIDEACTKLSKSKSKQERTAIARELCAEYPTMREPKFILFDELATPLSTPKEQKEGVKLGYELLATLRSDEYWQRDSLISGMIAIIPEDELGEFIGKFAHESSLDSMLVRRYHWNNEQEKWFEKLAKMMYVELRHYINAYADKLLKSLERAEARKLAEGRIKTLNVLSGADCPVDSVIGDGKVDIFTLWRMEWGIRLAAYSDNADTALDILNDVLGLFVKLSEHPATEPLDSRTSVFAPLEMYVEYNKKWDAYEIIPCMEDIGVSGFSNDFFKDRLEFPTFDWLKDNDKFKKIKASIGESTHVFN